MQVLVGIMSIVFGGYVAQPQWFNDGPYEFLEAHQSQEECQIVGAGTSDICSEGNRYVLSDKKAPKVSESAKFQFVDCDYWAGCYAMKEEK